MALVADVLACTRPEAEPTPKELEGEGEAATDSGSEGKKLVASSVTGWSFALPSGLAAKEELAEGDGSSPMDEDLADPVSGLGSASGAAWLDAATARHLTEKRASEEEKSFGDREVATNAPSVFEALAFETLPAPTAVRPEEDSPKNGEEASAPSTERGLSLGGEILPAPDMPMTPHPPSHPMAAQTISPAPVASEAPVLLPRESVPLPPSHEPRRELGAGEQMTGEPGPAMSGPARSVSLAPVAIELRLMGAGRPIATEVPPEGASDASVVPVPLPTPSKTSSTADSADARAGRMPEPLPGADLGMKLGGTASEAGEQDSRGHGDRRDTKPGEWSEVSGPGRRDREETRLREHGVPAAEAHPAAYHEERPLVSTPLTPPPRFESGAPEWRVPKAVTEVHLDPRFELNERAGAKTGPIELRIDVPHAGDSSVQLHLREHRGEIQLAVRTADAGLSQSLQESLPDLIQRLEGQRTESLRADHLRVDGNGIEGNFEARVTQGSSFDLGSQDASGENSRDGHPEQRSGERDSSGGQRRSDPDPHSGRPRNEARWLEAWRRSFLNPTKKESR